MSFQYISNEDDIPSDNFKININGELAKPYGNFIEEIMVWIDNERARLSIDPFDWHIYDKYTPVESGGIGLHDDFEGNAWEADSDEDVQRVLLTPSLTQTKVSGYYAPIRNYVGDLASGLYPVVARYGGAFDKINISESWNDFVDVKVNITSKQMGFHAARDPDKELSEILEIVLSDDADFNPEKDDHINSCKPKLCVPVLFDDRIAIYNVLNVMLDSSGLLTLEDQNKVCEWALRDENLTAVSGATAFYVRSDDPFGDPSDDDYSFYVAFDNIVRQYDYYGKPKIMGNSTGNDTYTITLDDEAVSFCYDNAHVIPSGSGAGFFYLNDFGIIKFHSEYNPTLPEITFTVKHYTNNGRSISTFSSITENPSGPSFNVISRKGSIFGSDTIIEEDGFLYINNPPAEEDSTDFIEYLFPRTRAQLYLTKSSGIYGVNSHTIIFPDDIFESSDLIVTNFIDVEKNIYNLSRNIAISPIDNYTFDLDGVVQSGYLGTYDDKLFYFSNWYASSPFELIEGSGILRTKDIGDGSSPGVPPGTGGSDTYAIAAAGSVKNRNFARTDKSISQSLWAQDEIRAIYRIDCREILLNNVPSGGYDLENLQLVFFIQRQDGYVIQETSLSDPPNPSTTWTSPNGGNLESIDLKAAIYTGSWPPSASSGDFNSVGTEILNFNVPQNYVHLDVPIGSNSTFNRSVFSTVNINISDINNDGYLYIICYQDTLTHNRNKISGELGPGGICLFQPISLAYGAIYG